METLIVLYKGYFNRLIAEKLQMLNHFLREIENFQ